MSKADQVIQNVMIKKVTKVVKKPLYKKSAFSYDADFSGKPVGYEPFHFKDGVYIVMTTIILWIVCALTIIGLLWLSREYSSWQVVLAGFSGVLSIVMLLIILMFCF